MRPQNASPVPWEDAARTARSLAFRRAARAADGADCEQTAPLRDDLEQHSLSRECNLPPRSDEQRTL
jgi:hypothetical protein